MSPENKNSHNRVMFTDKLQIMDFLKNLNIDKFEITQDLTVNVSEDLNIYKVMSYQNTDYHYFPFNFGVVSGSVFAHNAQLESLRGFPHTIIGSFSVADNQLTSLEGGPQIVGGSYGCANNRLQNLKGAPQKIEGNFFCGGNGLTSLEGAPKEVNLSFHCGNNLLETLEGGPQMVGATYECKNNRLKNLKGFPVFDTLHSSNPLFNCSDNPTLTSLEGFQYNKSSSFAFQFSGTNFVELASLYTAPEHPDYKGRNTFTSNVIISRHKKIWDAIQQEKQLLESNILTSPMSPNGVGKLVKI